MGIKDRLKQFISYLDVGQAAFESKVGMSNGYINNFKNSIGSQILEKIMINFPELSVEWLIIGKGEMLKSEVSSGVYSPATETMVAELEQQVAEIQSEVQVLLMEKEKYKQLLQAKDATIQSKDALLQAKDNIIALLTKPLSTSPTAKERGKVGSRVGSM